MDHSGPPFIDLDTRLKKVLIKEVGELPADLVVAESEGLEVDVIFCCPYGFEHGIVRRWSIDEEGNLVPARHGVAAQRLHEGDGLLYEVRGVRALLLPGQEGPGYDGERACLEDP